MLARCEELRDLTDGYFDTWATVGAGGIALGAHDASVALPGAIDPSGFVKGWSVERTGWLLEAHGIRNFPVNAGGDIRARGAALPDAAWRTGLPPAGVLSVTVTGDDLGTVVAYATAAFAMGLEGPGWTARLVGYEALTILADETVLSTPGFPLAPTPLRAGARPS